MSTSTRVTAPSAFNEVAFVFTEEGVILELLSGSQMISWSDWEHIARVYGKKRS
jgi:hypothetical protein